MEQEIDHSINQMNDEFRMTRTAAELTDLQEKKNEKNRSIHLQRENV